MNAVDVNLRERTTGEECGNERKNKKKKGKLIKEEKATSEKRRRRRIKDEDEEKEFGKENQMWRNLDGGVNLKERTTGEECGNERKNKRKL